MAGAKKPAKPPAIQVSPEGFTISPAAVKWALGVLVGLFAAYAGWKVVWDDIKTYWRLEAIQQVKDKETESKLHSLAQKAEVGRAWVFFSVLDFKADWREDKADQCRTTKNNCTKLDAAATTARTEAAEAKRAALDAGKDK